MSISKRLLARTAALSLIAVAALVLAEAGTRLLSGPRIQIIAPDPILGWRMKRNAEFRGSVTTNSLGFHDRERTEQAGAPVIVLGDSYVAGLAVRLPELLHMQMESTLSVPVMAAAAPAWSTGQQLLWFQEEGHRYRPRLVVLLVAPNDIRETYANGFHRIGEQGGLTRMPPRSPSWNDAILWRLLNHSTLTNHLAAWWDTNSAFHLISRTWRFTFPTEYGSAHDRDLFRTEPAKEILRAQDLFRAELRALRAETKRYGAELLLAVLPTKMEWEDPVARAPNFRPGIVEHRVKAMAGRLGIAWADLSPLRKLGSQALFLTEDYHLSAQGHRLVADKLSEAAKRVLSGPLHH